MSAAPSQPRPRIDQDDAEAMSGGDAYTVPFVQRAGDSKSLHFSFNAVQSDMDLRRPDRLTLAYTRTMMGFLLFNAQPTELAMIGLGGGSLARFILHHLPTARLKVVEINPNVLALRQEFLLPGDSARFKVELGDGAEFVRSQSPHMEALLVDGFDVSGQPPELASSEFYRHCAECLTPQGVLVANLSPAYSDFAQQVRDIAQVFGGQVVTVHDKAGHNTVVFASRAPLREQFMRHGWRFRWHIHPKTYAELLPELREVVQVLHGRAPDRP